MLGRRSISIENNHLRVTVLEEGGHIAEILDKRSGVNPLWIPPWRSIEPSIYDPQMHPDYGGASDARLLAAIMGHNLCLDIFGSSSDAEFAAGITPHGEGSVVPYKLEKTDDQLRMSAHLPLAQIQFQWHVTLVRLRLETRRLSVDGHLGRKSQPHKPALEWKGVDSRHGIRSISDAGIAARDGESKPSLRGSDISVVACAEPDTSGVLCRRPKYGFDSRGA